MAKKVYLCILCIGLALAVAGGIMLTMRAIDRSKYTPTDVISSTDNTHHASITVEDLPDAGNHDESEAIGNG